jgi:hypothetical protein
VWYGNGNSTDEINLFVLKFEESTLNPDSACHSLLVHEAEGADYFEQEFATEFVLAGILETGTWKYRPSASAAWG